MSSENSSNKIYTYRGKIHRSTSEKLLPKEDNVKRSLSVKNLVAVSGTSVDSEDSSNPIDDDFTEPKIDEIPNSRILINTVSMNPVLDGITQTVNATDITSGTESSDQESYNFELHPIVGAALADESGTPTSSAVQVHPIHSYVIIRH